MDADSGGLPPLDPEDFDVVVFGTDWVSSIVSAALARSGVSVLHQDRHVFYGGTLATFSGKQLIEWAQRFSSNETVIFECSDEVKDDLMTHSGRYGFDLSPRLFYSRGKLVQLLISSGVCRYLEFVLPSHVLLWSEEESEFRRVPCSKGEVFRSPELSLVEKTLLMQFAKAVASDRVMDEHEQYSSLQEVFDRFKLPEKIRYLVLYGVGLLPCHVDPSECRGEEMEEIIRRIEQYVNSVGVYGDIPLLCSKYGTSEIVQAFCRVTAVYGGSYLLSEECTNVLDAKEKGPAVRPEWEGRARDGSPGEHSKQPRKIFPQQVVCTADYLPPEFSRCVGTVLRCILLVRNPVVPFAGETFYGIVPQLGNTISVLQCDSRLGVCRAGQWIVHLSMQGSPVDEPGGTEFRVGGGARAKAAFSEIVDKLKPDTIFSVYFEHSCHQVLREPDNVHCAPFLAYHLTDEPPGGVNAIDAARSIFSKIISLLPESEEMIPFFDRIPEPEEVQEEMRLREELEATELNE